MTYYVYKITNNSNGKIYIGKTNDLEKRWYNHVYCALVNKEPTYFYNAIRKYGAKNFSIEVIEERLSEELVLERETHWIDFLKSRRRDIGYNMTDGGDGVSGLKHTEENKEKQRVKMLGRKASNETKAKMSKAHKGQMVSLETKEKISKANSGENNGMFGKSITKETRNKLSEFQSARQRKPLTKEHKRQNSEMARNQDRKFRISIEIKNEIVQLYAAGNYTKRQLSEKFGLKYNSVVKIIRTNKSA
jgi:hypothetical protein